MSKVSHPDKGFQRRFPERQICGVRVFWEVSLSPAPEGAAASCMFERHPLKVYKGPPRVTGRSRERWEDESDTSQKTQPLETM